MFISLILNMDQRGNREFRRRNGLAEYSSIKKDSSYMQIFVMGVGYGVGFMLALILTYVIVIAFAGFI